MKKARQTYKKLICIYTFQKRSYAYPQAAYQPDYEQLRLHPPINPEFVSMDTASSTVQFCNNKKQVVVSSTVELGSDAADNSTIQSHDDHSVYSTIQSLNDQ